MTPAQTATLLYVFAALEIAIGAVMLVIFHNVAIGAASVAIGCSLIAVATATRKKSKNG